jgi:hypothetical protein
MRVPTVAVFKEPHAPDTRESIRSVRVFHPETTETHNANLFRYLVLAIAFIAVVLLIAIALYYTQGESIHFVHTSLLRYKLAPHA